MKFKVRNHLAQLLILRKSCAHGKSKKAQRTHDKVSMKREMRSFVDRTHLKQHVLWHAWQLD
jgi:hypothetical protein